MTVPSHFALPGGYIAKEWQYWDGRASFLWASRVPDLYEGLRTGSFEPLARGAVGLLAEETEVVPTVQQPALFDFRRKDREDVVIGTVE